MPETPNAEYGRSEAEERMVRFGYYAGIVAEQWDKHPAAELLREGGYDVAAVMREVSDWCYGPGREAALVPPEVHRYWTDERIEALRLKALPGDDLTLPATDVIELICDWRNMAARIDASGATDA